MGANEKVLRFVVTGALLGAPLAVGCGGDEDMINEPAPEPPIETRTNEPAPEPPIETRTNEPAPELDEPTSPALGEGAEAADEGSDEAPETP